MSFTRYYKYKIQIILLNSMIDKYQNFQLLNEIFTKNLFISFKYILKLFNYLINHLLLYIHGFNIA